jgi:putative DNA primase/helicase
MLSGEQGKAARRFARACASARGLKAILSLAQIEPSLRLAASAFDADRHVLNVRNGVLDLESGTLHPHSPRHRMTKLAACEYDPSGRPELWLRHLDYIIGDTAEIAFLQRWFGRALSGLSPSDNCRILMPIGTGANGKTITVETVAAVLGDYAVACDFPTWCVAYGGGGGPREDLARLGGARLVVTSESGRGHVLDENLIKQYTGGELVSPRPPYARAASVYRPQFSMLMSTNQEPRMHDHSDGFWRRFLKIVFRTSIPEPDQDHGLLAKLHEELPQILAWMVEGYRQWREVGLEPPTSVLLATAESQRSSDLVGQFIEEHITQAAGAVVEMSAVYERYQLWCEQCGLTRRLSSQQLSSRLVEHGLQRDRDDRSRRSVLQDVTLVPMATTGIASWQT